MMKLNKFYTIAWRLTVVSTAAISVMYALPANANSALKICTFEGLCGEAKTVTEAQMADVAGKFTVAGDVVGMQLNMVSSWQAGNGQKLEGTATLAIGLPSNGQPGYSITQASASGSETSAPDIAGIPNASGNVKGSAGLNNINGASQVIQVAGNDNGASNLTAIEVTSGNLNMPTGNSLSNATYRAINGSVAQVDIVNNSISVQLKMPNNTGVAQQNVNIANNGNIHQNIQIASSNQRVINQLQLQIQVKPMTNLGLAQQGLYQALGSLRGQ
ncbi:MAG: hypothetical protein ACOH2B_06205 [Burkholderiaceae bacterium]